jgi:hypothetical protein
MMLNSILIRCSTWDAEIPEHVKGEEPVMGAWCSSSVKTSERATECQGRLI